MPDVDKDALISQAIRGDVHALERLLLAHHDRLKVWLGAQMPAELRSVMGVEDLLQETYIRVFRHIGEIEFAGPATFSSWLHTIALNQLRDALRRNRAMCRAGCRIGASPRRQSIWCLLDHLSARDRTPSRVVAGREAIAAMQVAMARLAPQYRQALELRYIRGWTVKQAAKQMNRTERAVQMLCYRGLRKLEAAMGGASKYLSALK